MKTRPLPFSPLSSGKISGRVRSSILVARQTGWWWSREEIRLCFFSGLKLVRVPGLKYWSDQRIYFLCVATNEPADGENYNFIHQVSCSSHSLANKWWAFWQKRCQQLPLQGGEDVTLQIYMDKAFLPVWVMVCLIAVLLCMVSMIINYKANRRPHPNNHHHHHRYWKSAALSKHFLVRSLLRAEPGSHELGSGLIIIIIEYHHALLLPFSLSTYDHHNELLTRLSWRSCRTPAQMLRKDMPRWTFYLIICCQNYCHLQIFLGWNLKIWE